uniref:Uncharacterized protein n=1 Tax=Helianthus annuus TaxID=4232 RepID=A0A251V2A3_HELAN
MLAKIHRESTTSSLSLIQIKLGILYIQKHARDQNGFCLPLGVPLHLLMFCYLQFVFNFLIGIVLFLKLIFG